MTLTFSKSARLLVQNWDLLDEIRRAEGELATVLSDGLLSLEGRLAGQAWWTNDWSFEAYRSTQIYIWHNSWRKGADSAIWLGVENLSPDTLFGPVSYSEMYLWVNRRRRELVPPLAALFEDVDGVPGEVAPKGKIFYVVRNPVRKCLQEELDNFDEAVLTPIINFFTFYAGHAEAIGRIVQET